METKYTNWNKKNRIDIYISLKNLFKENDSIKLRKIENKNGFSFHLANSRTSSSKNKFS